MTETVDPRLQRLVRIDGGTRPSLVVAVQTGGHDSALNSMVRGLTRTASTFRRTASEVRAATKLLDSEKGQRIGEAAAPVLKALKEATAIYRGEAHRIQTAANTASAVKPYGDTTPLHILLADQQLVDRFERMEPTAKAILVHRCTHESAAVARWADALLRSPMEISGLTAEEHSNIRLGVLTARDPGTAKMVESELVQAEQAQRAIQLALQVLGDETPGSLTELRTMAPDVLAAAQGLPEVGTPEPAAELHHAYVVPQHVLDDLRNLPLTRPAATERRDAA